MVGFHSFCPAGGSPSCLPTPGDYCRNSGRRAAAGWETADDPARTSGYSKGNTSPLLHDLLSQAADLQ